MTPSTALDPLSPAQLTSQSNTRLWTGRVMTALVVLFLTFDGLMKLVKPAPVVQGTLELGYAEGTIVPLGIVLLAGVLLYALPRTALIGAIVLTGYLGGAVATHVRVGNPLFSHMLFPTYVAALMWGGLALRDARLRRLLTGKL